MSLLRYKVYLQSLAPQDRIAVCDALCQAAECSRELINDTGLYAVLVYCKNGPELFRLVNLPSSCRWEEVRHPNL